MNAIVKLPLLALAAAEHQQLPSNTVGYIGEGLLAIGLLAGAVYVARRWPIWWDKWSKSRLRQHRTREAMDNRERQLKAMMQDIIFDGLLDASVGQKISLQEERKLYAWIAEKLDMPELIPAKDNAENVKSAIRSRRAQARKSGGKPAPIPGPKPGEDVPVAQQSRGFKRS